MKPTRSFTRSLACVLAFAAAAAFAPAARAADAFLKIEGVDGESNDSKHKDWIELDSFQVDPLRNETSRVARSLSIGSQSSGAGAGKVTFNPFSITRKIDKASPVFFQAASTGRHFPAATISMRKSGGTQQEYLVVKLQDVTITSYKTGGGGAAPTETFVLNAARAELDYTGTPAPGAVKSLQAAGAAAIVETSRTITKVTPSAASATTGQVLTFLVEGAGACVRSRIDFGDGTVVEFPFTAGKSQPAPTHTYTKAGAFEVRAYGLADPWAKLPAPPPASEQVCSGHALANVTIRARLAPAPAVR